MKEILNKAEQERLAAVIGEMEDKTSGEIRLMIVRRSSATAHVQPLLWSLLVAATFLILWYGRHDVVLWEGWWLWPAIVVVHAGIAWALSRFDSVQRRLTPFRDLKHQVEVRAEVEFTREGLTETRSRTGILLFVSLLERQAVVLADKGIAGRVEAGTWDQVIATILEGARSGRWAEKFEVAIRLCGGYLAAHFPQEAGDTNELSNAVIIKD